MRRPDRRSVASYVRALVRYHGVPPRDVWQRFSLRTRAAAIALWRTGKDAPVANLPETPAARRKPQDGDL